MNSLKFIGRVFKRQYTFKRSFGILSNAFGTNSFFLAIKMSRLKSKEHLVSVHFKSVLFRFSSNEKNTTV